MQALIAAINRRHRDLLGSALHVIEVNEGIALPYTVLTIVSETPGYTFSSMSERTVVQFDVYAQGKVQVFTMAEALRDAFDDCVLDVPGYAFGKFEREFSQPLKDGDAWRVIIQYVAQLQKL